MKKKDISYLLLLAVASVIATVAMIYFYKSNYFIHFLDWSKQNIYLYFFVLVILKVAAVIYPPLPGSILTIGSIPILGWQYAYLADVTGSFIGAVTSFLIAKRFGVKVVKAFVSDSILQKLKETKVRHNKQIEAVITMRILVGGSTIVEAVNYGAGLLNISLKNFVIGFLVSHPLTGIPVFYFADSIFGGENTYISIAIAIISLAALYKLKGRYFE